MLRSREPTVPATDCSPPSIPPIRLLTHVLARARAGAFWRLAKRSDVQTRRTFDAAFANLCSLVEAVRNDGNTNSIDKALKWLGSPNDSSSSSLYARRHKWALCFTGARLTRGCDASQSAETYFSGEPHARLHARPFAPSHTVSLHTPSPAPAPALCACAAAPQSSRAR